MELRQFKYFVAIVDCGSLSRAAQQLFIAQSALSKQMAELEGELGTQLLLRSRNGVAMTEAGKVFYEYAQGITKQVRDARAAVHVAAESVAGKILQSLAEPFDIGGTRFEISASVGVAVFPHDGRSVSALLRTADAAMYQAKAAGRNRVVVHRPKLG